MDMIIDPAPKNHDAWHLIVAIADDVVNGCLIVA